ncbi:PAS domain S-box protein [Rufibacter latericius]|uniref:histidine kinase n=1 Tax=Rufibacter latericius TaxID=2487040 RepID=A0A3M9ML90_9BACT|nr:PAS domain S-box protein [Rufibacter latericius]RNI26249.1 PAS domain S-box protein [Rufibacter latericius]
MPIQRTLFGVFLAAFLSLVFFTAMVYFNLQETAAIDQQEKVSLRALKSIEGLYGSLQDMEEGASSYLSTGQRASFLQYQSALPHYPQHLRDLQQAGVTDTQEKSQLKELSAKIEAFSKVAATNIGKINAAPAARLQASEQLKNQLASIRLLVHQVEEKERGKLHFADEESAVKSEQMFSTFLAFSAFMFFFFSTTYLFINRNLANRAKAAKILKEKEQLFSGLFYKSPIMLSLVEASSGKILDANEMALQFFGHSREQVIGKKAEDLDIFVDSTFRQRLFDQLKRDQKVAGMETQLKTGEGGLRNVVYNIEQVFLNNKKCFVLAFEDITDRKLAEKKLKENEALFSQIFYKSPVMKSISEADTGIYMEVNDNYSQFFGYEKEELIGKTSMDLNLWKNPEDRSSLIRQLREKGALRSLEMEARTKNGEMRHISTHADLVKLDGKECLVTALVDITEKKEADDLVKNLNISLKKSVAERIKEISDYKYALDQSAIVTITNTAGIFLYANDNCCAISGYTREELIGQHYRITDAGYHSEAFFEEMERTLASGRIWKGELKTKSKNGTYYWTETTIVPILDASGVPHQCLSIRWDITPKKDTEAALLRAFEELEKSSTSLKEAQALSHLGSWDYDHNTLEGLWSDEMYQILGTTPAQTKAGLASFLSFVHPEDKAEVEELVQTPFLSLEGSCQFPCRVVREDGSIRYLLNEYKVKPDSKGDTHQLMGITHDITKERLAQLEKERITSDLLQRNKDLEQFAYIVSHNLRAPVANIIGLSDLLKTVSPETPLFEKSMQGLKISVDKLDNVINDLNNVLQIRREVNERKEQVDLQQLVEDIKSMTSGLLAKENVTIRTDFSDLDQIYTIKSYLHSIFTNLISNSIKYRQAHQVPAIEIQAHQKDGKSIITFRDNGLGIDLKAHQNKIFGLYKRFHFHTDGKGMGLFMVKTQVEALGGRIHVQSQVNQGTEFSIEFGEAHA